MAYVLDMKDVILTPFVFFHNGGCPLIHSHLPYKPFLFLPKEGEIIFQMLILRRINQEYLGQHFALALSLSLLLSISLETKQKSVYSFSSVSFQTWNPPMRVIALPVTG